MTDWEDKNKAEWNYYHRDEGKPTFSSGAQGRSRGRSAKSGRSGMPFPLAILLGAGILFLFIDAELWRLHVPIIADLVYYSCHTQTTYLGTHLVYHAKIGMNLITPNYDSENICGLEVAPAFYYLIGAQVVTLFTCWIGLIPFLISYIKEKSVEKSFSEMKLLPLHKQWKFLVCVGVLGIAWSLFWIEYFLR